ncbi:MAG: oligosaccharide flippase family protein [Chlamydiia bacterium]|nr:oligosaccharide flippase family protein [Chlamydiia bacterium]
MNTGIGQASLVSASHFAERVLGFLCIIILSRSFGSEGIGEFYYFFSLMSLWIPLMDMSFDKLIMQKWHGSGWEQRRQLFSDLLFLKLALGGSALLMGWTVDWISRGGAANPLGVLAAFLALYIEEFGQLFRSPARALKQVSLEVIVPIVAKLLTLVCVIFAIPFLSNGWQAIYLYVIANTIGAVISLRGVSVLVPLVMPSMNFSRYFEFFKTLFPFTVISSCMMFSLFVDSVILGRYSISEVGLYNAAYRIILVFAGLSQGVCYTLFPRIAELHAGKQPALVGQMMSQALRINGSFFGLLAIVSYLLSGVCIELLYGAKFSASVLPFKILTPIILFSPLVDVLGHTIEAVGQQNRAMIWYILAAGSNFFLNLLLIPFYGMIAAAWTTVLTALLLVVGLTWQAYTLPSLAWSRR